MFKDTRIQIENNHKKKIKSLQEEIEFIKVRDLENLE